MRVWTVHYTARRKRTVYEAQRMTVTFTQKDYEKAFGPLSGDGLDQLAIEQLAVEKGEALLDVGLWERSPGECNEALDESDFEVEEIEVAPSAMVHYEIEVNVGRKWSAPVWCHLVDNDDGTPCVWKDESEARAFIQGDARDLRLILVDGERRFGRSLKA